MIDGFVEMYITLHSMFDCPLILYVYTLFKGFQYSEKYIEKELLGVTIKTILFHYPLMTME